MTDTRRGRKRLNSGSSSCSILSGLLARPVSPDDFETDQADTVSPTPPRQKSAPESSRRTRHRRWKEQLNQPYPGGSSCSGAMSISSDTGDEYLQSKASFDKSFTLIAGLDGSTSERCKEDLASLDDVSQPETDVEDGLLDYNLPRPDSTAQFKIQKLPKKQAFGSHGPVSMRDIGVRLDEVESQSSDLESAVSEFNSNTQRLEAVSTWISPPVSMQGDINEIKGDVQGSKADLKRIKADVDDLKMGKASTPNLFPDPTNSCPPSKLASKKD